MTIKMIVCDLDGTLLNDKDRVSAETVRAFEALPRATITTVIATGRPWLEAKRHAAAVNAGRGFIGMNGCQTFDVQTGDYFLRRYLPVEASAEIIALLDTMPVFYEAYTSDAVVAPVQKEGLLRRSGLNANFIAEFAQQIVYQQNLTAISGAIHKFFIPTTSPGVTIQLKERLQHRHDICIVNSLSNFIEIIPVNISKAIAIDALCRHLNIKPAEVLAIGDSQNDIEMLQYAGVAVAMGNAIEAVKHLADYIVPDNNQHGVAWTLNKILPKLIH